MPSFVLRSGNFAFVGPQSLDQVPQFAVSPEMVPRNCRLGDYDKRRIPQVSLEAGTEIIAYASPDSTYAVTKKLMDDAQKKILIGIYDFSASHVRETLLAAMARGVQVSLMLDIDGKAERRFFDELVEMGVRGVAAPSCANSSVRLFSSSHEKVIVIDDEWCLVQSGNYSANSIPLNEIDGGGRAFRSGNRDTGLAVRSKKLAELFTEILESDMAIAEAAPEMLQLPPDEEVFLVERAPRGPSKKFKSKRFVLDAKLAVLPVVSPDNYMDVMPGLIAKARKSIFIEQQYIRASQPKISMLLKAIGEAKAAAPDIDVRIVLGKLFERADLAKERQMLALLEQRLGLELGKNVRYVNTNEFVHCHNKMIIIDGEKILVSSQNWSDSAVSKNREAGLFLHHDGIASYFTDIFEYDWNVAFHDPETGFAPEILTPQSLAGGGYVRVEKADYQDV